MIFALLTPLTVAGVVATHPPPDADAALAPRRIAVVIGVQDYRDPALAGLRYAEKDAADLAAALLDPAGGGFDRVFEIHGAEATRRDTLLNTLAVATADLGRDDTFLLYLSGHGTLTLDPIEGSRLWFLPSDGRIDAPADTGIAVADLERAVNALPARRRVLVLDTCHNGRTGSKSQLGTSTAQLVDGLRGEVPAPRGEREVSESEARLYAAQYYQPAMEDPTLQNGVYTHFLVEALRQPGLADLDRDGLVDVAEAHEYARDHTITYTGGLQVPRAEYRIVGREDIYLSGPAAARSAAERALVAAYDRVLDRARLLVNGTPRGELPGLYAVDPGPQTIEVTTADGRRLLRERVHLRAGESVGVEALMERRAAYVEVLGGAELTGGVTTPSGAAMHPVGGSAAVVWVRPGEHTSGRWRPDLHLTGSYAAGTLAAEADQPFATGTFAVGGTWALAAGPVYVGPEVDLRLPWRVETSLGWLEAAPAATGGLVAGVAVPVGSHTWLDVRADAWAGALPWEGEWTPWWGGGVRAGIGRGR